MRLLTFALSTLYGGGCAGSPTPTTPPANGRFSRSAVVRIAVGSVGNSAPIVAAGASPRMNSGEKPTLHAGSQKPQKPDPGEYSMSVPKRRRCSPLTHVNVSTNV
jgi:hypothetical protein